MRKPIFMDDITHLGVWYWVEIEGYEKMARMQSGALAFMECEIMGWECKTLSDIWQRQREVNYAPRWRMWQGKEKPTAEERAAGEWRNDCRVWLPDWAALMQDKSRIYEWQETGRTQWPKEG